MESSYLWITIKRHEVDQQRVKFEQSFDCTVKPPLNRTPSKLDSLYTRILNWTPLYTGRPLYWTPL